MLKLCNGWRNQVRGDGYLNDVMDGNVWNKFRFVEGRPFLDMPNIIVFALNIDWFNPFEHKHYSIGAVYLIVPWLLNWTNQITQLEVDKSNINLIR